MSADDNAPEQAREVEVVARAISAFFGKDPDAPVMELRDGTIGTWWQTEVDFAERILSALAPLRAAERQEAAREALLAAAEELSAHMERVVDPDSWRRDGYDDGWASDTEGATKILRDRADGVTGREGV